MIINAMSGPATADAIALLMAHSASLFIPSFLAKIANTMKLNMAETSHANKKYSNISTLRLL